MPLPLDRRPSIENLEKILEDASRRSSSKSVVPFRPPPRAKEQQIHDAEARRTWHVPDIGANIVGMFLHHRRKTQE